MNGEDKRRLLSALCHGSIFFSSLLVSVGIPFAIFFATEDSVVKENAKAALNLHINIYGFLFFILALAAIPVFWILPLIFYALIAIPVLLWVCFMSFIMPIIGIASVFNNPSKAYRYPCIFHFFK